MSHFCVLVVTENEPTEEELSKALMPFHEFECTGLDNEYVQNIDITEKARKEFTEETRTRFRDPEGGLHDPYGDKFYRDPTEEEAKEIGPFAGSGYVGDLTYASKDWGDGRGYRAKIQFVPEGWEKVKVPASEIESFVDWVSHYYGLEKVGPGKDLDLMGAHKYGWVRVNEAGDVVEAVDRTNPNSKWDWWVVGGRWEDFLLLKNGTRADSARKIDIDLETKRNEAGVEAGVRWDKARALIGDTEGFLSQEEVLKKFPDNIKAARDFYHNQRQVRALHSDHTLTWFDIEDFLRTREEYVQLERHKANMTFALLKDGQWFERGNMGWFGRVSNEDKDWPRKYNEILDQLPDSAWLTIVDCHV